MAGYLLIPHELLHLLGYRLVGKRCHYRWGDPFVTAPGPFSHRDLVGMLFPFVSFVALFLAGGVLSAVAYGQALQTGSYGWFIVWTMLAFITGIYAGTAIGDL